MSQRLKALNRILVSLEAFAAGGLVLTVSVVVLLQVGMRYLFAYPNPWSEEVSRFCFIWMSMLGASLAVEHRAHFGFDQVTKGLAPRWKSAVETFAAAVVFLFALLLIATGIALMGLTMGERSSALNLPIALVYAAVPVSGALMVLHLLAEWGQPTTELSGPGQPTELAGPGQPTESAGAGRPTERTVVEPPTEESG